MSQKIYGTTVVTPLNPQKFGGGGSGLLVVTVDGYESTGTASHTPAQIIEHLAAGGDVVLKNSFGNDFTHPAGGYASLMQLRDDLAEFSLTGISENYVYEYKWRVQSDGSYEQIETMLQIGNTEESDGETLINIKVTEAADGTVTMVNTFEGGDEETIVLTPDASGNPASVTYNGVVVPIEWVVSE